MTQADTLGSILLVDDDAPLRERLTFALCKRGFTVQAAPDVDTAMKHAAQQSFGRAIVDLRMPGKSGLVLIGELRRLQPEINLLILSAYGSINTAVEAMRLGANNFLQKPASVDEILLAFELRSAEQAAPPETQLGEVPTLERAEWEHINRILAECDGNVMRAAKVLGLHRRTLQRKLSKVPAVR